MRRRTGEVRRRAGPPGRTLRIPWRHARGGQQAGSLSIEAVLVLPVIALLVVGLVQVAAIVADVLLLHEAARAGARTAATTSGLEAVADAAHEAAPELEEMIVHVNPVVRRDGDVARVEVSVVRRLGPVAHTLRASAVVRVEPAVGTTRRGRQP